MNLWRDGQGRGIVLMEPALLKFHRYLLLLAHFRSYSTLLCHILGSHPQICGYSEAMIPYETAVDLIRLNCEVFRAGNYRGDCEYVVDKLAPRQLRRVGRRPAHPPGHPAVDHPGARVGDREPGPDADPRVRAGDRRLDGRDDRSARNAELAAVYYISRLGTLRVMAARLEAMGKRGLFLTAESLMADTAATFRWLERELGLSEPLREEYRLFPNTRAVGSGDTSATIRSGRIIRDRDDREEAPISIPRDLLDRARQAYGECLAAFRRVARPVPRRG